MKALRVLHLIPSFAGGGAERQLAYLARAQAESSVDVHIGFVHDGPNLQRVLCTSVSVHRLPCRGNHDPRLILRIKRLIAELSPDIVQTWLLQMDVMGGLAAKFCGVPWVLSERCSAEMHMTGWKNAIRKVVGRRADAVVANSEGGLDYWRDGRQDKPVRVIRNIVPVDEIEAAGRHINVDNDIAEAPELIVAAGRFEEQKNWEVTVQAIDLAIQHRAEARAIIFGSGPLGQAIRELCNLASNRDRIHVREYTSELWQWLKRASLFVSVSRWEGTPNVVLEAIACKCPVVVSDIPAHREILSEDKAVLVSVDDPVSIAMAIEHILRARKEACERAVRAFELLGAFSSKTAVESHRQLYSAAIRGCDLAPENRVFF